MMITMKQGWSNFLCLIAILLTATMPALAERHGGIINIEIDADTIPLPGPGGSPGEHSNCNIGKGAMQSDPSLTFSISIVANPQSTTAYGAAEYTKSIDFKQMQDVRDVSWKVVRYSGILGNPLSDNPADWVPISPNGVATSKSPYLAVAEHGNGVDFDAATFSQPFIDAVPYCFSGMDWNIDYANDGINGAILDGYKTAPDKGVGSYPQQGCYFYGLEVTVDGVTAYAKSNIIDTWDYDSTLAHGYDANIHIGTHICQIFDREGSDLDPAQFTQNGKSYEALAFEEESRQFYLLNYSDPAGAVKVPVADSEAMIDIVFAKGPRLPYRYLVWTENYETGAIAVPQYSHIAMRYIGYLKYWDYSVQVGTPTAAGLVLDIFDDWNTRKFSDLDMHSWANAGAICYGIASARTPNPVFMRPYLPEAKLTGLSFEADGLGEAEQVVSEDIIPNSDEPSPMVYNNVEHYTLTATFTGTLPVTPNAVTLPGNAQKDVPVLTKIDGVEIVLGGRKTIYVDLNRAALHDGTFMVKVSGLDPNEFISPGEDVSTVKAYISNTRWYTWAPQIAMGNHNNVWDVYSDNKKVVTGTLCKELESPDIITADVAQAYWADGTKSLILNSIYVRDAEASFNNLLEHNIVLTVGRKGSNTRKVLDPENPFHPASYYTGRTGLGIEIDRIPADETWEDQEFRIAQVYFFDVSSVTAESDEADRIISLTITDENGNVTEADTGNKLNAAPKKLPALGVQAQEDMIIDHVSMLSPVDSYLYSTAGVRTLTGIESIPETAGYSISGNMLTITGNDVHVHSASGILLASRPGTYSLTPGFYIVSDSDHTHTVVIR